MKKIFLLLLILFLGCNNSDIKLKTVDASDINNQIKKHKGSKAVLINFWATYCVPCIEEFPMIVDLSKKYSEKGMQIYFVSADWLDRKKEVRDFLLEKDVKGLSFIKEEGNDNNFINEISREWSGALPFTIVYDKNGNLSDYWEMKKNKDRFESAIIKAIKS
ncbi:MAG: TlpA family protein disulfide reductase [Candidatus Marinimicrobia bacterium]|jgi:thiol-disulfide isomerase/thioredoxin|nr:TlpA family protein disulfide reductase [Candidatus Neomarinimicrobiota bacterium]MDC0865524.1 TlpA disulfide reductase family protein [bacterium]MBT3795978.1 TlpA family protein disulfide reductase [Candidatus Neomarinimicrobiota bacterium]MBT4149096.1 TlpA family protein disulfide reductase [Candidatus Neomarinimicrobiota bacterium]MBT4785325.1 TlpA family protein disulfide reductase [Candidatus Neomarinimicrobiota bacterium]|tara:strand:+ start:7142 stop:7627 length:486 start_codon:yes stop_codon:yes gene_type:complete